MFSPSRAISVSPTQHSTIPHSWQIFGFLFFFENVDISCMLLSLTQTDASTKCISTPAKLLHFLGANFNLPTW